MIEVCFKHLPHNNENIFVNILARLKTQRKLDVAEMFKRVGDICISIRLEVANWKNKNEFMNLIPGWANNLQQS